MGAKEQDRTDLDLSPKWHTTYMVDQTNMNNKREGEEQKRKMTVQGIKIEPFIPTNQTEDKRSNHIPRVDYPSTFDRHVFLPELRGWISGKVIIRSIASRLVGSSQELEKN